LRALTRPIVIHISGFEGELFYGLQTHRNRLRLNIATFDKSGLNFFPDFTVSYLALFVVAMSLGGSPQSFQANARIDLGNRPEDWKKNE
jgi:hypothetical protein